MRFLLRFHVLLKPDVADVQGNAIQQNLARHDYPVTRVKAGKYFEVEVEAESEAAAVELGQRLASEVFSNPVIEVATVEVAPAAAP